VNAALRRRHLLMWIFVGPLLVLALGAALMLRPASPPAPGTTITVEAP